MNKSGQSVLFYKLKEEKISKKESKEEKISKKTPFDILIHALNKEVERLKNSDFLEDYKELSLKINKKDIIDFYEWLVNHSEPLKDIINSGKPLKFPGRKLWDKLGDKSKSPCLVTIYINRDERNGNLYVDFDTNSKMARHPKYPTLIKKDPTKKSDGMLSKVINFGRFKVVRKAWSFNVTTGKVERSAAQVCKGEESINLLKLEFKMNRLRSSLVWYSRGFMEYFSHSENKDEQLKAIAFAPRAEGDLLDLINGSAGIKASSMDLGDILWMSYASVKVLAQLNAQGILHRDVKPENFLIMRNQHGVGIYLTDFGLSMSLEEDDKAGAGTIEYMAFDHPVFSELIACHAKILQDLRIIMKK